MFTSNYLPVREDWLGLSKEEILEPKLRIVDAHHHFYDRPGWFYLAEQYLDDAASGHNVVATVYMQAQTRYREQGLAALKPVGETEFVVRTTGEWSPQFPRLAKGIVGHADLMLGSQLHAALQSHIEAGEGRFRGIRHLSTWDADRSLVNPLSAVPRGLLGLPCYVAGVDVLSEYGLSYDAWLFFHQLPELYELALRVPGTPVIVNHCGGVLRIGAYANSQAEVYQAWKREMTRLASLPNVFVKLGGLGMRINGFGFEQGSLPPSSQFLADTWRPWMEPCIEAFGANRCMFESNFPVDKGSYSYATCWNAFKRLSAGASAAERQQLFEGTASRVYRLD